MDSKKASAGRVIPVVKLNTPLIWYSDRRDSRKPSVSEVSDQQDYHLTLLQFHSILKGVNHQICMHQGPPDTAEIMKILPQKYRKKLVSQEEIEFIQHGGPE